MGKNEEEMFDAEHIGLVRKPRDINLARNASELVDLTINEHQVAVFIRDNCGLSAATVAFFSSLEVDFIVHNIDDHDSIETKTTVVKDLFKRTRMKWIEEPLEFPFIFIGGVYLGGYNQLMDSYLTGVLKIMLLGKEYANVGKEEADEDFIELCSQVDPKTWAVTEEQGDRTIAVINEVDIDMDMEEEEEEEEEEEVEKLLKDVIDPQKSKVPRKKRGLPSAELMNPEKLKKFRSTPSRFSRSMPPRKLRGKRK
ncbi:unnamed protein product [Discosporangium mesarthrocarpum]